MFLCQKTEDQVRKLIAGPDGLFICDECVGICSEIMEEEFGGYDQEEILGSEINLMKPEGNPCNSGRLCNRTG